MYQHNIQQKFQIARVLAALNFARDFFVKTLDNDGRGSKGLSFLREQGISAETTARYRLGYTTSSWNNLRKHCQVPPQYPTFDDPRLEGFTSPLRYSEFVTASLLIVSGEDLGHYDRFRGRLMFPFLDETGQTIGFAGRRVDFSKGHDPLWTSSQNISLFKAKEKVSIYKVDHHFFGLFQARDAIKEKGEVYVATDFLDGLKLVDAGFANTIVAPGVFTEDHVKTLRKITSRAILVMDEKRGVGERLALLRADVLLNDLDLKLSFLPGEWRHDMSAVKGILVGRRIDYVMFKAISLFGKVTEDPAYKEKAIRSLVRTIAFFRTSSQRDHYVEEVAKISGVPPLDLKQSVKDFAAAKVSSSKRPRLR